MEKLIEALKLIHEECNKHTDGAVSKCYECPFGTDDNECVIALYSPNDWKIEERTVTRLMK